MGLSENKVVRALLGTILIMALTGLARAETLTSDEVERFIASIQELKTLEPFASADEAWWSGEPQGDSPETAPMSHAVELMKGRDAYDSLAAVVSKLGFASPEAWGRTGDRVMFAMMSLEMGNLAPGMEKKLAEMMADIENNPQFSAEQKAEMKRMMSVSRGMMSRMADVPEADRKAVRPHVNALKQAMEYSAAE